MILGCPMFRTGNNAAVYTKVGGVRAEMAVCFSDLTAD